MNKSFKIISTSLIHIFVLLLNSQIVLSDDPNNLLSYHHTKSPLHDNNMLKTQFENDHYVSIDFTDVDIEILIKFISDLTGTNFILDHRVRNQKITIMSPTKISVSDAYQLFKSVLEVHGLALVQSGGATKIIPASEAAQNSIETRLNETTGRSDENFISQFIQLNYADAHEIKKLFSPLISKNSKIQSYPQTNSILITDTQSNIKRLLQILSVVDKKNVDHELSIVKIKHTASEKIVKTLTAVFNKNKQGYKSQRDHVKVISDEHTNAIIILARPYQIKKIKNLINILDQQVKKDDDKIHVRYLEHAKAEEMVKVLNDLSQKTKQKQGKQSVLSSHMAIVADKATNSLIITAEKSDYADLNDVIQKIDIPRPMVYIECMIMEVSVNKNVTLGPVIKVGDLNKPQHNKYANNYVASFAKDLSNISTPFFGVINQSITIGNQFFPSITALYNAGAAETDFNIISKPQIMTLNNVEAEINVGDKIPYMTKGATKDGNSYNSYEYNDVGVKLKVKPQINQKRFVRLEITQTVETIVGDINNYRPQTSNRSTKTTIVVKDKETAIISGLIKNKTDNGQQRIPCLGNIPLLKLLFRSTTNTRERTNMFLFLTPHILLNADEATAHYDNIIRD
jgi:general secretion pathway protein D